MFEWLHLGFRLIWMRKDGLDEKKGREDEREREIGGSILKSWEKWMNDRRKGEEYIYIYMAYQVREATKMKDGMI